MKRILLITLLPLFLLTGCVEYEETAEKQQQKKTTQAAAEMNKRIGMPAITNYQERKLMKMIFELRDKADLVCHAYIVARNTGKLVYLGTCLGYGIPYSVQYTNPEKLVDRYGRDIESASWEPYRLPQADPNGLYMPTGLSATWLIMYDPETKKTKPVYIEPEIIVSPFRLD